MPLLTGIRQQTVFVTGGSRGIGAAIVDRFLKDGFKVVNPSRAELDLSDPESVIRYLEAADLKIDVLINNAGENVIRDLSSMPLVEWQRTLNINLNSAMLLMKAFYPHMRRNEWGRIVNIGSIFSLISRAKRSSYASSKAALLGLTRSAAIEWGEYGILVNAVCPGYIETDLTRKNNSDDEIATMCNNLPLRRLGTPSEVAEAVLFLGSNKNSFITGQTLIVDGGFSIQ